MNQRSQSNEIDSKSRDGGSLQVSGVLVGRARHQASALSAGLRGLGAEVLEIPFIEIRKPRSYKALDEALKNLTEYDWLILTSVNGVDALWERLRKLHVGGKPMRHLKMAAIGPATRQAIEQHGVKVNVVPKEYVAESVVASLRRKVKGKRVLLARAKVARDVIPRELRKLGAQVDVVEAYETVVPQASRQRLRAALKSQKLRPDVDYFHQFVYGAKFRGAVWVKAAAEVGRVHMGREENRVRLASIGPITSSTLREFGLPVDIEAAEYTIPGLIKAIAKHEFL